MLAPDESYPKGNARPTPNPRGNYNGLDREELRALVWAERDEDLHRFAYDPRYCRMFGANAGLLLSQLVFWSDKGDDPDGWVYETKDGIGERWGVGSRHEVDTARHRLKAAGVLEWTKRPRRRSDGGYYGPSPTLHYRVDLAALAALLDRFDQYPEATIKTINCRSKQPESGDSNGHGVQSEHPESGGLSSRNPATQGAGKRRLKQPESGNVNVKNQAVPITESTSETTSEVPSEINNIELSEGSDLPSAPLTPSTEERKEAYNPTTQDDNVVPATSWNQEQNDINDEEHSPALADVVAAIEAQGVGIRLLEHARRAGAIGPGESGVGRSNRLHVHPDRRRRRRYITMEDGEIDE